jgi:hypothetical protein
MTRLWPSLLGLAWVVDPATILRWHRTCKVAFNDKVTKHDLPEHGRKTVAKRSGSHKPSTSSAGIVCAEKTMSRWLASVDRPGSPINASLTKSNAP